MQKAHVNLYKTMKPLTESKHTDDLMLLWMADFDVNEDCVINLAEFFKMAQNWQMD